MTEPHILLFDLTNHTHYAMYLRCWLDYWRRSQRGGRLSILVSRHFVKTHPDVVQLAAAMPQANVRFLTPTADESTRLRTSELTGVESTIGLAQLLREGSQANYIGRFLAELFYAYSQQVGADISVMCHIEPYLPLMIAGVPTPPKVAGIFAAPFFYYDDIPGNPEPLTDAQRQAAIRQKFTIARALKHPALKRLMFNDQHVGEFLGGFPNLEKVALISEPVALTPVTPEMVAALRQRLTIEDQRQVVLVFGHLSGRKGIELLIEAVKTLPQDRCQHLCLVIAGSISTDYRTAINSRLDTLSQASAVQIVRCYDYIPDDEASIYFHLADLIWTVYHEHNGNSNVNFLAAAAGRSVISSGYGSMGYTVRQFELGFTVDRRNMDAVRQALIRLLDAPETVPGDNSRIRDLIAKHDPRLAAEAFFAAVDGAGQ